jgi:Ca2+-binding RTX toxin-like protein
LTQTVTLVSGQTATDINFGNQLLNNAPTLANAIADQTTKQGDAFNFQIPTDTFTDIDAGDVLTYSATLENGNALPIWLTFNPTTRTFSGTPTNNNVGSLNVKAIATDKAGASVSDIFALTVQNVNDAPIVQNAIADQTTKQGDAFNFQIPTNTFTDIDAGDVLTYSATLENGNALPSWLSFNATTRSFSGTPNINDIGLLNLKATATDKSGASISDRFIITIANAVTGNNGLISGTGAGDDVLIASSNSAFNGESNILFTGAGSDRIDLRPVAANPNSGNNRIDAGSGDDTIFVSKDERVFGGDGNDTFDARDGKGGNRLSGGAGDDIFYLGFGDRALGGDDNDQFFVSSSGNNLLSGGAGADIFNIVTASIIPSAANTIVDFQSGTDLIGIGNYKFTDLTFSGNNITISGTMIATLTGFNTSTLTIANFTLA